MRPIADLLPRPEQLVPVVEWPHHPLDPRRPPRGLARAAARAALSGRRSSDQQRVIQRLTAGAAPLCVMLRQRAPESAEIAPRERAVRV